MPDPLAVAATVAQGIRLIALVSDQINQVQSGLMTPEELQNRWARLGLRIDLANSAWEQAGAARADLNPE